jgi:hypothetical protein
MAKVTVRVLYESAFAGMGIKADAKGQAEVEAADAEALIAQGYAELIKPKAAK